MENKTLEQRVKELEDELKRMSTRTYQYNIPPNAIKQRHIGEGVRFLRSGLAADRPASPETSQNGLALYWAYDTGVLSIWSGTAWLSETFT